jgi:hypothetical protein
MVAARATATSELFAIQIGGHGSAAVWDQRDFLSLKAAPVKTHVIFCA